MLVFGQNRACEGGETADEGAFQRGTDDRSADASIGRCSCGGGPADAAVAGGEFGYAAKPGSKLALMDAVVRCRFRGELHHVRHGSELTRIRSGETGVDLREEA